MVSSPPDGGETQPIIRIVEDLPAPFGPRKPNTSPRLSSKSIPSTAVNSPNVFLRPLARIRISGLATSATLPAGSDKAERLTRTPGCSWHGNLAGSALTSDGALTRTGAGSTVGWRDRDAPVARR